MDDAENNPTREWLTEMRTALERQADMIDRAHTAMEAAWARIARHEGQRSPGREQLPLTGSDADTR